VDGNDQLGELLGVPLAELIGRSVVDLVAPEWRERLAERLRTGAGEPFEHVMLRTDGTRFEAESQAKQLRVGDRTLRVTALRDISRRKHLEEQLRQSQRLESIGRLAGGVAHDFNNLLTVILSLVDILMERPRSADERADLDQIREAADRAAQLTEQLLAFARRRIIEPKVVDPNALVSNLERMLRRLLGEHIRLVTVCRPDLGTVRVDPSQFEQVVVNLAVNARDAMVSGGTLTIETQNVTLGPDYAAAHAEVTPGEYVMVAVSDTGTGMDSATLSRIFEPFFTTKEQNRGTGLGLATSYGIVRQSGGSLWVYSEPGRGTTFKIYLPRIYEALSQLAPKAHPEPQRGAETLLLVEDDAAVRRVAVRALTKRGYRVIEASAPSEARERFAQWGGRVDALITDVVLPEMSGRDLAHLLRQQNAHLRVLYTSGYTENTIVHHGVVDADVDFLAKPYVSGDLARRIREVLDRPARNTE
jgi:PAS domain S-box-containing protein